MKHLIFAGDSHTGVFHPFSDDTLAIYTRGALTMDSFSRGQSAAYLDLVAFLKSVNRSGCTLVLCLSEVDLRAHFWRDMPMLAARGLGFDEFVQERVDRFIARADALAAEVGLANIILWGAPASQLTKDNHSEELPATGDNMTRNALTHWLNHCLIRRLGRGGSVLRFATPFYGMVSDDLVTDTRWLRDGVHLKFELKAHGLALLQPLVERSAVATFSTRYEHFKGLRFGLQCLRREAGAVGASAAFRTWVQADAEPDDDDAAGDTATAIATPISTAAQAVATKPPLTLNNQFGRFSLLDSPHQLGQQRPYHELVLRTLP
jgi:hypothetical protein